MKYFLDQEFIEGFHKPILGKKRHFIDLISIGIVCEDGREYYAISNEFNPKDADSWVRHNVISKLESKSTHRSGLITPTMRQSGPIWKSNEEIKNDLLTFFGYKIEYTDYGAKLLSFDKDIQVYGYYADYDWVLLCSLFGRMIDLPTGFPMYCRDLKQMFDHKLTESFVIFSKRMKFGIIDTDKHTHTLNEQLEKIKAHPDYPKQTNEHNALADAKWNYELYKFLQTL